MDRCSVCSCLSAMIEVVPGRFACSCCGAQSEVAAPYGTLAKQAVHRSGVWLRHPRIRLARVEKPLSHV
jgi:hypothetical protein